MKIRPVVAMIALASIVLLGALEPAGATAQEKGFVGSWIVDIVPDQPGPPPVKNLATFTRDGLVINTDPEFGGGHGIWKKVGREISVKILTLVPAGHPFGEGTITATATGPLDKGGNPAPARFTTVFDTTNFQATVTGTVVLTRIKLGP